MLRDAHISKAVQRAAAHLGSNAELARSVGVDRSTIGRLVNGIVDDIADAQWERLYPHIRRWLPDGPRYLPRSLLASGPFRPDHAADPPGIAEDPAAYHPAHTVPCPPELREICEAWPWIDQRHRDLFATVMDSCRESVQKRKTESRDSTHSA